ncbi:uncharacterized protein LOC126732932 [Quercus robur]|uniref:uncharacterized protein LOC126690788 n=1 Tax=Quercus robur TaxID=38942 RepID=UPI002163AA64|nr:uncharacterized protein LOC126690788 [Quercus robur]XP_050291964.1 uncharacterized protein LOC126732932 [Quercus robur]
MSETSNYFSSSDGHFCDLENCRIRTSLKLHSFGRRFYSCRYWSPDDDRACKFFKWLDTSICCTRGAAVAPIVIAKFNRLEHAVEVANEESKQAHALTAAALERERVAKRKFERAKVARMISEDKAKKLTIALVVLGVMFLVLLILSTRFGEVKIRQMCLP